MEGELSDIRPVCERRIDGLPDGGGAVLAPPPMRYPRGERGHSLGALRWLRCRGSTPARNGLSQSLEADRRRKLPLDVFAQTAWDDDRAFVTVNSRMCEIAGVKDADLDGFGDDVGVCHLDHVDRGPGQPGERMRRHAAIDGDALCDRPPPGGSSQTWQISRSPRDKRWPGRRGRSTLATAWFPRADRCAADRRRQGPRAFGLPSPENALQGPCREDASSGCLGEAKQCSAHRDEHPVTGREGGVALRGLGAAVGGRCSAAPSPASCAEQVLHIELAGVVAMAQVEKVWRKRWAWTRGMPAARPSRRSSCFSPFGRRRTPALRRA